MSKGYVRRAISTGLLLVAMTGWAEEPYFYGPFWRLLGKGADRAFLSSQTLISAAVSAPVTYAVSTADRPFQRHTRDKRYLGKSAQIGNFLGQPYSQAGTAALVYGISRWADSEKLESTSALMLESWALTATTVHLIKPLARRERPDGSNRLSFPSNHAAGSFALATAAQLRHGWRAGVPSYLLASFLAFSRLEQNKHYASDTLFGALLGAHSAVAVWKSQGGKKASDVAIFPAVGVPGLVLNLAF